MKYTEQQLFDLILPMIATAAEKDVTNSSVIKCTAGIVELIKQDREAQNG